MTDKYGTELLEKEMASLEDKAKVIKALAKPGFEKELQRLREHYARLVRVVKTRKELKAKKTYTPSKTAAVASPTTLASNLPDEELENVLF